MEMFTWSNSLILLLGGNVDKFTVLESLYMGWISLRSMI